MFEQLSTVAINEIRVLVREKTFLLLLLIFFLLTLFSAYIGWSTKTTILAVYRQSVITLKQAGTANIPSNPFTGIAHLSIFRNMIIYIFLVGSLMAIVVGHRAFIRERKSGVTQLIFSKPLSRSSFILGKILGITIVLLMLIIATFLVSIISSALIPNQQLTMLEAAKLFSFYIVSFLYMFIFSMLGLIFSIILPTESLTLLVPMIFWVAVTFIIPELTTGQNPVALLNPTNIIQTTSQGPFFNFMHTVLSPFSVEQHYTTISQPLLETQKQFRSLGILEIIKQNGGSFLSLMLYFFISVFLTFYSFGRYKVTNDKIYE
ncbi:ABC transporter permease [Patescibacteria group bacterium]|nr:ABC transporter permease [Patescibacteria group bacterium]